MDLEEGAPLLGRQSNEEAASMREKFCRLFFMAVSFMGFILGVASLFYLIHINQDPTATVSWEGIAAMIISVVSLATFFVLVDTSCRISSRQRGTYAAVPIPVATMEQLQVVFRRSQSERTLSEAEQRAYFTRSFPPYVLLSTDQIQSSAGSMDLFLSAESRQTDSREASTETVVKAPVTTASPVQTPIITISEVETLPRESDTVSNENPVDEVPPKTNDESSIATDEEGIRKRKVTPPEEQKYEPEPEKAN